MGSFARSHKKDAAPDVIARHMTISKNKDETYSTILLDAIGVCRQYKPRFGSQKRSGFTLEEFNKLYGNDPFYSWMGLDSPLLYAAHKAAGGMTSIYRQIGIGCQRIFLMILTELLGLTTEEASWSYVHKNPDGTVRKLSLDGRIPLDSVRDAEKRRIVSEWLRDAGERVGVDQRILSALRGVVFEVRQGYKSKDSKRQNADIANAAMAITQGYLPVALLLSNQIDDDIAARYEFQKWLLLRGTLEGTPIVSTYVFSKDILGYDLAGFFRRNSTKFKAEVEEILKVLLKA